MSERIGRGKESEIARERGGRETQGERESGERGGEGERETERDNERQRQTQVV